MDMNGKYDLLKRLCDSQRIPNDSFTDQERGYRRILLDEKAIGADLDFTFIRPKGLAMLNDYLCSLYIETSNRRRDTRRYWITTGIAVAALIKAFLPEISEGLAAVLTWLGR